MWLFALLAAWPLIEIALFVTLGGWLGLWLSLAIVVGTALLGVVLIRLQGPVALINARAALQQGIDPRQSLASGAMGIVAGILLILPGFLTDTVGLLLMFPPVRSALMMLIVQRVRQQHGAPKTGFQQQQDDAVIDGDWRPIDPEQPKRPDRKSRWTED